MEKTAISTGQDFTSVLPLFKELILETGVRPQDNLVFAGCPGPCYSMSTFFGFGIRDLGLNLFFAADAEIDRLWRLEGDEELGMVAAGRSAPVKAKTIVLMSGLCTLPVERTQKLIESALAVDGVLVGEAPALGFFEEREWDRKIPFDYLFEFSMVDPTSFRVRQGGKPRGRPQKAPA